MPRKHYAASPASTERERNTTVSHDALLAFYTTVLEDMNQIRAEARLATYTDDETAQKIAHIQHILETKQPMRVGQ